MFLFLSTYPTRERLTALAICLVLWGITGIATAQQSLIRLHLQAVDSSSNLSLFDLAPAFTDSTALLGALRQGVNKLRSRGYFEASIDSIHWTDSLVVVVAHTGPPYRWARLRNGNVDPAMLAKSGFRLRLFDDKPFDPVALSRLLDRLLQQAENNGYPFASVWLDSLHLENGLLTASIAMDKGELVRFDSLSWQGDLKLSQHFLRNYLGIRPGQPYSRRLVLKSTERLRNLPFLQQSRTPLVAFNGHLANLTFFLEKRKASRFDFLLGLLPDNTRPQRKLLLTGTFNAELHNAFGQGERLLVAFERLRPQTQQLQLAITWPYLPDLPLGLDASFQQYKRDTSYTDISGEIGLQYQMTGGNYFKLFWKSTSSNLITVDTAAIRKGRAPEVLDLRNNAFGLAWHWQRLDYRFNPHSGHAIWFSASTGRRRIVRNQAILNVSENFYDTLPASARNIRLEAVVQKFVPLGRRSTVKLAIDAAWLFSSQPLYRNEEYRIGGNRRLRGFDEESLFASAFAIATVEYRLLTGQNSWFYLFTDAAYLEDKVYGRAPRYDRPLGIGAGITFETKAGVFSLGLAFGKQQGNPLQLRNPKVHFGYVSLF
ncbi:MAG: hypothetical protein KatS3mg029_0068 [Saprospiraceae bacterium]|nr:MAG: hypothetical protein KatS3mg029_0068 [Saprospiraceae bacterium]